MIRFNIIGLLLVGLGLVINGCNGESKENQLSETEPSNETIIEEVAEEELTILEELELYAQGNDVGKFNGVIMELKAKGLVNDEIIAISDSFIDKLIKERDFEFLKENFTYINMINSMVSTEKYAFEKFMEEETNILLDEMQEAVRNKYFSKVKHMYLNEILLKDNDESSAIYHYSLYLEKDDRSYRTSYELAKEIPNTYSGRLKEEITAAVTDKNYTNDKNPPISYSEWGTITWVNKNKQVQNEINNKKLNPFIGMTSEEALKSTWGKPKDINRTTTAYGTREQWVYDSGRYLYFKDGYITTIQE